MVRRDGQKRTQRTLRFRKGGGGLPGFTLRPLRSFYFANFAFCFSLKGLMLIFWEMSWRRERRFWDCLFFIREDGFYRAVEEASEFEGERETGIELAGFDGVDGLAGDFETLGEVGLAPVAFGAEDAEAVFHRYLMRMNG
jgi:hypothetical protein